MNPSTAKASFDVVHSLNRSGLYFAREGRFDQAIRALTSALGMLQGQFSESELELELMNGPLWKIVTIPYDASNVYSPIYTKVFVKEQEENTEEFIYYSEIMTIDRAREELCSVILYNLGLYHQLHALESGEDSRSWNKAQTLYSMCSEVLSRAPPQHSQDSMNLVLMACATNFSQIYSRVYDRENLEHCKTVLIATFRSTNFSGIPGDPLLIEDKSFFFLALTLNTWDFDFAPAA